MEAGIDAGPRKTDALASTAAIALRAADLALAGTAALAGACVLLARQPWRRRCTPAARPRLLAFSSTYSLSLLRAREAEHLVTHRDLRGYFEHVWSVNPLVGADPHQSAQTAGRITSTELNDAHTVVEATVGRFARLQDLPHLNFALSQLQLVLALDRIVTREGVAIIRADPYYGGLLALLLARLSRRAVEIRIIANHDAVYEAVGTLAYPRLFRRRSIEQRVARYTLSRADRVVAGSADNREFARNNGAPSERLRHAGHGGMIGPLHLRAPAERDELDDAFGLGDRPIVACVSRLEPMKHPEDVVRAIAAARERHPRVAGVLIGDGAMREQLERLCVELGVRQDVVFAGDRDQRWIASFLSHATVVAVPLAGLALVEAALSATPIVAYDVEWHSELITHGDDGLLVEYRDTDAMAAAICALVEDLAHGRWLGAAARERALAMLAPEDAVAHERGLADELLAATRAPTGAVGGRARG